MSDTSEFPGDIPLPTRPDADEWRDIDVEKMGAPRSTDFASADNETLTVPIDREAAARTGRRSYADGSRITTSENVRELGARTYEAWTITCIQGSGGYAGAPVRLLGDDPTRMRAFIVAQADPLIIGSLSQVMNGQGFTIPPATVLETEATEPIYAAVPANFAGNIDVSVWAERA